MNNYALSFSPAASPHKKHSVTADNYRIDNLYVTFFNVNKLGNETNVATFGIENCSQLEILIDTAK